MSVTSRRCGRLWLAIAPAVLLAAGAQAPPADSLGITTGNSVPLHLENGLLYLGVSVAGSAPLSFVVDTGATATSVDPSVAQAAGYKPGTPAQLVVARRALPEQPLSLASTGYIKALSGHPSAGVLGQAELRHYALAVDFDRKLVGLLSPELCPSSAAHLPIVTAGGLPFVEGTLLLPNGEHATGLFLVDTAQPGPGIVLASGFVAAHPGLIAGEKVKQPADGSAAATTLVRLKELQLGPYTLRGPIAAIGATGSAPSDPRLAGVLGLETLSHFNFLLNQRYASLYLEPNRRTHDAFEMDMSGLSLKASDGGKVVVAGVSPGSPASQAGIRTGDILLSMEGKTLAASNLGSVTAALRSSAGALVHMELERGGSAEQASFRLRRML